MIKQHQNRVLSPGINKSIIIYIWAMQFDTFKNELCMYKYKKKN